jgi:hypothetical protein
MGWKNFRDRLAIGLVFGMPLMWALMAWRGIALPGEVIGCTITVWTFCCQFYFRKANPEETTTPPS